jgi:hypothetical protein
MPTIEFIPTDDYGAKVFDPPLPAAEFLPDWYKQQERWAYDKPNTFGSEGLANLTVRACMPVFDMLTAGYILPCQTDINVHLSDDTGEHVMSWPTNLMPMIGTHSLAQVSKFPIDFSIWQPQLYKFQHNWIVKTPKGYSTLFTHPFWRGDTPFYTLPAIVDTDKHPRVINFPFLIKRDWFGVIDCGTPVVQMIPFKRENWDHKTHYKISESLNTAWDRMMKYSLNRYKEHVRSIKIWK